MVTGISQKRMKIAQVITRLDWGGSPDIVRIICNYLEPELYDIRLISGPSRYPSLKTRKFLERLKDRIVVVTSLKRKVNPLNDLITLVRLYLLFRREKFDIVHTHTAKAGILARIAAHLSKVPVIIHTPHGHNFYGYFSPWISKMVIWLERFMVYFTDKIIVLTELEKRDFIKFGVADAGKISLIYQGLELDKYAHININKHKKKREFNIEPEENVVGMIGRLEPIKGPDYFIQAAIGVAEIFTKVRFLLVGEGSMRRRLEQRVETLGRADRFIFTGWREDIAEIISILDILVLPSLNEAVGIVLIEAQAQGVPVVATKVGGIPEIVKDGQTGILVPPKDIQAIAEAIGNLMRNNQLREKMGEEARRWIGQRFNPEIMIAQISDLYGQLIKEKNN